MGFGNDRIPKKKPAGKPKKSCLPKVEGAIPDKNPLDEQIKDGELTGDIQHDDAKETGTALNLLRNVDKITKRVMGNGYWTTLVFPDEDTCERFLKKTGWLQWAEGRGAYIDGLEVAKALGIDLGHIDPIPFKSKRTDVKLETEVGIYDAKKDNTRKKA